MQERIERTSQAVQTIWTDWRDDVVHWVRQDFPKLLVILIVTAILLRVLHAITRRLEEYSKAQALPSGLRAQQLRTLASIVDSVGTVVIYFLAIMQVLPLFDVDVKPILASAGIVGLAVGFGAQTLVKDVINGFFILLEDQYGVGDVVRIAGVTGGVEAMTLRKTVIRDASGTVHTVPNSEIKVVSNLTRDWAQVSLNVTVDYNESSDRVITILKGAGAAVYNDPAYHDLMVAEPEVLGIERVTGREVEYLMVAKVKPGQQWTVSRVLRQRTKEVLSANNVHVAPPRVFLADPGQSAPPTEVR